MSSDTKGTHQIPEVLDMWPRAPNRELGALVDNEWDRSAVSHRVAVVAAHQLARLLHLRPTVSSEPGLSALLPLGGTRKN